MSDLLEWQSRVRLVDEVAQVFAPAVRLAEAEAERLGRAHIRNVIINLRRQLATTVHP